MTQWDSFVKRAFDVVCAAIGLILFGWLILLAWGIMTLDTGCNGMFVQVRVGRYGRLFKVYKIRTMRPDRLLDSTVTTSRDPRITRIGRMMRRLKLDELPQLFNVLIGDISLVGPRPDVPGYADTLSGEDRLVLSVRPGLTGPATLKYRDEETLLASVADPERYNREVIYPDKIAINKDYVRNYSFLRDLRYILRTLLR